ncbi:unnamed protein product [Schistosoma mattheei]|uniref:Uncharacterized protein n=1 Tax=Schistosoma mattheei TaxID=31246 RepID=A0A183NRE9_9TREM|nr:unnamed protein product [Schistosoma mattheei]
MIKSTNRQEVREYKNNIAICNNKSKEMICEFKNGDVSKYSECRSAYSNRFWYENSHEMVYTDSKFNETQNGLCKELHNSVVLVVDNIFGYSCGTEGWALHAVNEADEPHLFGSIREFLSPNGRFLEVLSSRLTLEFPSIYHDFPLWLLSELALCDFENSLYRTLFDDYLGFYLYTDPTTVNVMASKFHILRAGLQTPGYQKLTFVARHYSLYVGLLLLFMERVTKIDLHVCRNAHMVYRVTKVFSQDGFKMLLLNTEKILSEQQHQQDGSLSNVIVSEYQGEQSGLWNPVIISTVERVLNCMMITKVNLQSEVIKKMDKFSSDSDGWFDKFTKWLCSFLIFDMDNSDESVNKCIFYLTEGIHSLREFFAIQETFEAVHDISLKPPQNGRIQWDDLSASPIITRPHLKSPPTSSKSPIVEHPYIDNLSPSDFSYSSWNIDACSMPKTSVNSQDSSRYYTKLTPLDRFQIIMGVKRPYVCQQLINREYASTMNASYENRYILTVCKYLENKFTEMMKQHFIRWCSLSGIRGRFARQLLLPSSYPKQHESQSFLITNNPRLNGDRYEKNEQKLDRTKKEGPRLWVGECWSAIYASLRVTGVNDVFEIEVSKLYEKKAITLQPWNSKHNLKNRHCEEFQSSSQVIKRYLQDEAKQINRYVLMTILYNVTGPIV